MKLPKSSAGGGGAAAQDNIEFDQADEPKKKGCC